MEGHSRDPGLSPESLLHQLPDIAPDGTHSQAAKALQQQPREKLAKIYQRELWAHRRKSAWVIAEEFTRRGIPPSFRPSPFLDGEPCIPEEDIFLHDLQWLSRHYPQHRSRLKRYPKPFTSSLSFKPVARNLLWRGLRQPHFYIKVLALTEDQQVECVYLRGAAVRRRMHTIESGSSDVFDKLKIANRSKARARAQEQTDWKQTVQRRHDIWRCGTMADWLPTRTAELYKALTGIEITRALAGKIIYEVHRDYPLSRPPGRRRRRAKPVEPIRMPPMGRVTKVRRNKARRTKTTS